VHVVCCRNYEKERNDMMKEMEKKFMMCMMCKITQCNKENMEFWRSGRAAP